MAKISKEEIALLKEMIADPSVPNDEKDLYRETLSQFVEVKEVVEKKTPTKRKTTARKKTTKKPKPADIDKAKAEILKRTGKTEEECEKIIDEYKELRRKSVTRKKKETTQKEKAKKRTTKLKKEGKTIEGTTEKNVEATLDTATEKVVTKIDKEVEKIEKTSKTEKQVAKKINTLVSKAVKSNKKLFSDTAKELAKVDPNNAKQYLMSIKKEIDTLLKKYEYGGEIFDGTGDVVDYGAGGYTQPYNIQEGLISTGNNVQFAKGGMMQGYDDRLDDSLGMRTGRRSTKEQDYKDRRDESKGMEKGMGRRPYSSVGTMDMENRMMLRKGGRLYDDLQIDKGAFRKEAMKRNISTTELMNKVLDNENRYSMKMVKQARLMKNMRK